MPAAASDRGDRLTLAYSGGFSYRPFPRLAKRIKAAASSHARAAGGLVHYDLPLVNTRSLLFPAARRHGVILYHTDPETLAKFITRAFHTPFLFLRSFVFVHVDRKEELPTTLEIISDGYLWAAILLWGTRPWIVLG